MDERSKARVCGRLLAAIAGSNPEGALMSVLSVVFCRVEVSARGRSLVQRSPTDCVVSLGDVETSRMGRPGMRWAVTPEREREREREINGIGFFVTFYLTVCKCDRHGYPQVSVKFTEGE